MAEEPTQPFVGVVRVLQGPSRARGDADEGPAREIGAAQEARVHVGEAHEDVVHGAVVHDEQAPQAAGVGATSPNPALARSVIRFFLSPEAAPLIAKTGLEPVGGG